jgi:hypothetical protein
LVFSEQVAKHHDKLQAEKEAAGIAKLQASLPKLCRPVLAMALQDSTLDADRALLLLRRFQSDMFNDLAALQQRRQRLQDSLHVSPSDSSDSGDHKRRKRSKREKHRKEKKEKTSKHKHKKDKDKDRSKRHKRKRDRSGSADEAAPGQLAFGSFGIIREADYTRMRPEFAAWASEAKHIDSEALPRFAPDVETPRLSLFSGLNVNELCLPRCLAKR